MDKNTILISGAIVFKEGRNKNYWLLTKQKEGDNWELTKSIVRRGESSVRTVIRVMGEKGGMSVRVLEEAGRINGATSVNGRTLTQKYIYYLVIVKSVPKELIGFTDHVWLDYQTTLRKLSTKKEKDVLKKAYAVYKIWKKGKTPRVKKMK